MEKTKFIAKFAIKICLFAALLSQGEKECLSQAFSFQDDAFLSQEESAPPHDGIGLSQIQEIFILDDFLQDDFSFSQSDENFDEPLIGKNAHLSQEISSRKTSEKTQKICDNFIAIENVEVLVDNVREEHLERQIQEMANVGIKNFIANPKRNASEMEASLTVRQRSYYKNTKKRNSIYVYYSIFDKSGERFAEDWFIVEGKSSIISAAIQVRQIKKAVRGMKRRIRNYGSKRKRVLSQKDENK